MLIEDFETAQPIVSNIEIATDLRTLFEDVTPETVTIGNTLDIMQSLINKDAANGFGEQGGTVLITAIQAQCKTFYEALRTAIDAQKAAFETQLSEVGS